MASPDDERTVPAQIVGTPVRAMTVVPVQDPGRAISVDEGTITVGTAPSNTLVLSDRTVSRFHLELERAHDRIRITDLGSTNGTTVGALWLRGATGFLTPPSRLRVGNVELEVRDGDVTMGRREVWKELAGIRGQSPAMQRLMSQLAKVAATTLSVLVVGESGTGKELVARALHDLSPRREQPFVTVDCGAISPSLFASELFGHEKGAFTGALATRRGAFEQAHKGTLFLDEIGELPADQQAALLGALERRRFRRVGGAEEREVDVRVVAATNRDLRAQVNSGAFRLDLYHRLAVASLALPPLRERAEDLPILIDAILATEGIESTAAALFTPDQLQQLSLQPWPGNVRELKNLVLSAAHLGAPDALGPLEGSTSASSASDDALLEQPYKVARRHVLDAFEARYVERLLQRSTGGVRGAARIAGLDRNYLADLMRRHGAR